MTTTTTTNPTASQLSSSIDNLLDSFFTTTTSGGIGSTLIPQQSSSAAAPDNETTTNSPKLPKTPTTKPQSFFQRTKSISMSETGGHQTNHPPTSMPTTFASTEPTPMEVSFSLNDLANEYLAANPTLSETSSLVDLIDLELGPQLNLVDLSTDTLMIKSTSRNKNLNHNKNLFVRQRNSLSGDLMGSQTQLTMEMSSQASATTTLQLIPTRPVQIEQVRTLFEIRTLFEEGVMRKNVMTEWMGKRFDYECQVEREKARVSKRRRIVVENEVKSVPKGGGGGHKSTQKSSKASKRKLVDGSSSSSSLSSTNAAKIQIFDFSIPSPDDLVMAKQKFAFKNIRFK